MAQNRRYLFFITLLHFAISTGKSSSLNHSSVLSIPLHSFSSFVKFHNLSSIGFRNRPRYLSSDDFYLIQLGVGHPAQTFNLIVDTTAKVTWLQCQPCTRCYPQFDPIFDPTQSASYQPLPCGSPQCTAFTHDDTCNVDTCLYEVDHVEYDFLYGKEMVADFTRGQLVTEAFILDAMACSGLCLGSVFGSGSFENVVIGCGHDNGGKLDWAAGKLALGPGDVSFPSQIKTKAFSYCLAGMDSDESGILQFNVVLPKDSIVVPMVPNPKFETLYYIDVTGISVAGSMLDIPESVFQIGGDGQGGVIIDSSSSLTLLQLEAYRAFEDAFIKNTKSMEPLTGSGGALSTCYQLPSSSSPPPVSDKATIPDGIFPGVAFHFAGGKTLSLEPKNILVAGYPSNIVCLNFAWADDGKPSVIGHIMQQGMQVTFDLANKQIGFSPNKC